MDRQEETMLNLFEHLTVRQESPVVHQPSSEHRDFKYIKLKRNNFQLTFVCSLSKALVQNLR